MSAAVEAYFPVATFFPGRKSRAIAESCRKGDVPGAIKIGKTWFVRASDLAAGRAAVAGAPAAPSVDDAIADLRARGVK